MTYREALARLLDDSATTHGCTGEEIVEYLVRIHPQDAPDFELAKFGTIDRDTELACLRDRANYLEGMMSMLAEQAKLCRPPR